MRGLRPLVICLALLSCATAAQAQEATGVAESPSLDPSASPPVVDIRPAILRQGSWFLDFEASGLSATIRGLPVELGSVLTLSEDAFSGGTGAGGGCDAFSGAFVVDGDELRLVFETLGQGCDERSARRIVDRLVNARHFKLADCDPPLVGSEGDPGTTCGTLTIWGTYRSAALYDLVYRSSSPHQS